MKPSNTPTMQVCNVIIRLSSLSSAKSDTTRENVTPAEVIMLRSAKGENSVIFNGGLRRVGRSNAAEVNRLQLIHGKAFSDAFPGQHPMMPTTFDAVGLDTSRKPDADPYVPAPDEAQLLEKFIDDDEFNQDVDEPVVKVRKSNKTREDLGK